MLDDLRSGDDDALEEIFGRFFDRLKSVARRRVSVRDRKVVDDEDLALWAINTFQRCVREGMYPKIRNRVDVWRFLVSILDRKSVDHLRKQRADKRGGGFVRGESFFEETEEARFIEQIGTREASFEMVVDFLDVIEAIVQRLDTPSLRVVLTDKFAGYTVKEISARTGMSVATINRKLKLVRNIVAEEKDLGFSSPRILS